MRPLRTVSVSRKISSLAVPVAGIVTVIAIGLMTVRDMIGTG